MDKIIMIRLIIIGVVFLTFMFLSIWYIITTTTKLVKELNVIKDDAEKAKTFDELDAVTNKFNVVIKKCWHASFETSLTEIKAILNTKYKALKEEKYVYVTYDPLLECVVCVHSEEEMECEDCKPINEERKSAYFLETVKCLVKNKKE